MKEDDEERKKKRQIVHSHLLVFGYSRKVFATPSIPFVASVCHAFVAEFGLCVVLFHLTYCLLT